jgi:hypothetical protein
LWLISASRPTILLFYDSSIRGTAGSSHQSASPPDHRAVRARPDRDFSNSWFWVQEILDQDYERRLTFDASAQASMVFCRFVVSTGRRLEGDLKVVLKKSGRMLRAVIDQRVALRFKKLTLKRDGSLIAGNVKTNAQGLIYYQLGFDGMQDARPTEVTFGYTTDATNTSITGVYMTCPISWYANKWTIPFMSEEGEASLPFAAPSDPMNPTANEATFIITPKIAQKTTEGK